MGGYNTFCEVLSFDKRALIVPRHTPRLEQAIRAEAAERGFRFLVHDVPGIATDVDVPRDLEVLAR